MVIDFWPAEFFVDVLCSDMLDSDKISIDWFLANRIFSLEEIWPTPRDSDTFSL